MQQPILNLKCFTTKITTRQPQFSVCDYNLAPVITVKALLSVDKEFQSSLSYITFSDVYSKSYQFCVMHCGDDSYTRILSILKYTISLQS